MENGASPRRCSQPAPPSARCTGADARSSLSNQPGDFFFNFNSLINTFRAIKSPRLPFIAPGVYFQIESLPLHCTDKYRQGGQRPHIGAGSERRCSGGSAGLPPLQTAALGSSWHRPNGGLPVGLRTGN